MTTIYEQIVCNMQDVDVSLTYGWKSWKTRFVLIFGGEWLFLDLLWSKLLLHTLKFVYFGDLWEENRRQNIGYNIKVLKFNRLWWMRPLTYFWLATCQNFDAYIYCPFYFRGWCFSWSMHVNYNKIYYIIYSYFYACILMIVWNSRLMICHMIHIVLQTFYEEGSWNLGCIQNILLSTISFRPKVKKFFHSAVGVVFFFFIKKKKKIPHQQYLS